MCERFSVPIRAVGLYVPAGSAPLPSTAIMLAVPAAIAGCPVRVHVHAADAQRQRRSRGAGRRAQAGVEQVFKVGGAQAIAAMAYGTASIPKCDKVFGPGNACVTAAKLLVAQRRRRRRARICRPGVTEVMVIADDSARADFVAADLLAQAEHSADAQAMLVTTIRPLAAARGRASATPSATACRARAILAKSVAHMRLLVVDSLRDRLRDRQRLRSGTSAARDPRAARAGWPDVTRGGRGVPGHWSPESMGDYCSGPNHTLPTYGYARAYSGLSLEDFQKRITVQELTPAGLAGLGADRQILAGLEGLDAHAAAVTIRLRRSSRARCADESAVYSLARPEIVTLKPYAHAAWLPSLTRLHANEAPWRPAGRHDRRGPQSLSGAAARSADRAAGGALRRFRRATCWRRAAATKPSTCCRASICAPAPMPSCSARPTFGMYQVARAHPGRRGDRGAARARARLGTRSRARAGGLAAACQTGVSVLAEQSHRQLCSNWPRSKRICTALDGKAIVVIDEAYIEWSRVASLRRWLERFQTLAILRTCPRRTRSRARASARCSAHPELIQLAKRVIPPYCPGAADDRGGVARAGARGTWPPRARASKRCSLEREYLRAAASQPRRWSTKVWPSDANFLLIDCRDADRFMRSEHGRRPHRARLARPSGAAAFVARLGGHARAERCAACIAWRRH